MLTDLSPGAAAPGIPAGAGPSASVSATHAGTTPLALGLRGLWRVLALVASDAVALVASGVVAQFLTTGGSPLTDPVYAGIWTLVPLFTVSYGLGGLYPGFGVSAIQLIRTLSRQTSLVFVVIAGSAYAMPPAGDPPVRMFVLWWTASLACVPLMRVQVSSVAVAWAWWREPVLLFGSVDRVPGVIASLAKAQHLGYRPVGVVLSPWSHESSAAFASHQTLKVIDEGDMIAAARTLRVGTILVSASGAEQTAAELRHHFRHVILVNTLESPLVEPTAVRYLGSAIGIEYQNGLLMRGNRAVKRIIDVILSVAGLVLLFPFAAAAAVAITVCSPGPWWHAQWREGRSGVAFRMWKLRTMYPDAEARLAAHLARDADARAEWRKEFKLTRDPRVIPGVGGLLRRWSLDEYPQFWNVIRGEMSLVGPRALPPYHLEAFGSDFRALRAHVRPGITGMWQVMSRGRGAIGAQEALDRYYIYNWSIWMDFFVLAKTVMAVSTRRGAR